MTQKEIYLYTEFIVRRFLKFYINDYKRRAMDAEDLKQEAFIIAWNIMNKYKNKPPKEVKKLVSKAVGWKLNMLRLRDFGDIVSVEELKEQSEKYTTDVCDEKFYMKNEGCLDDYKPQMFWDEMKSICDDFQYNILYKRYYENRTMKEIGKEYKVSKQYIEQELKKALKKLKKYVFTFI